MSADELLAYRGVGDAEVDELFSLIEKQRDCGGVSAGEDVLAQIMETAASSKEESINAFDQVQQAFLSFHDKYATLPLWVNTPQLERGQEVFLAYMPAIGLSLYYRSLVPGFSIPPLAHVLKSTGYLAPPSPRLRMQERLEDTFALLAQGLTQLDALRPVTGEGWKACLRVRFLHAKVRRAILAKKGERRWDSDSLGIPINEEDMAATLLAFSFNSLLGVETILGFPLSERERLDFLHVWRYMGWLLGVDVHESELQMMSVKSQQRHENLKPLDPCGPGWIKDDPNPLKHSQAIFESIMYHILHPDGTSVEVSNYLLRQGRTKDDNDPSESFLSQENWFYYRCLQCRRFVGDALADALELPLNPKPFFRWRSWLFSTFFLLMVRLYSFAAMPWSPFRQRIIGFHRKRLLAFSEQWYSKHTKRTQERLSQGGEKVSMCQFAMLYSP